VLLERLRGKKDYPEEIPIVPELIIRESTIPPNPKRMARHG
jgi:LacI family transcriptional regulator